MKSAGLILAAGSSRRLGSPKQLLLLDGRPLLERVVGQAVASSLSEVVVVLGAAAAEIRQKVDFDRARVVENPEHLLGMSSSLRFGLAALGPEIERVMVILGDQPAVSAALFDRLLALHSSSGLPSAALSIGGLLHPPVVLERSLWGDLSALEGDVGCRAVIRGRPELVAALSVAENLDHPIDIDTAEDYENLIRMPFR